MTRKGRVAGRRTWRRADERRGGGGCCVDSAAKPHNGLRTASCRGANRGARNSGLNVDLDLARAHAGRGQCEDPQRCISEAHKICERDVIKSTS
jgi:hypothetical protein